jgi:hypothetical protein
LEAEVHANDVMFGNARSFLFLDGDTDDGGGNGDGDIFDDADADLAKALELYHRALAIKVQAHGPRHIICAR